MNDLMAPVRRDVRPDHQHHQPDQDGKIKGYAVTTKFKVSSLPELPTLDSGAIPGFEVSAWHAHVGAQGFAEGSCRQARERASDRR